MSCVKTIINSQYKTKFKYRFEAASFLQLNLRNVPGRWILYDFIKQSRTTKWKTQIRKYRDEKNAQ